MTTKKRTLLASLVIALVLTAPVLGGIIHSDSPSPDATPEPTPTPTETTDGIIHSDVTGGDDSGNTLTATAVTVVQLVLSLI